jgi:uroporphyrinogen decarboxylase
LHAQIADIPAKIEADLLDYQKKQRLINQAVLFQSFASTNGGLYYAYNYLGGVDLFSYLMADNPELAEELIEHAYQYSLAYVNQLPADYDRPAVLIAEDIAFKGGVLFSPEFLRNHLFGRLKNIVSRYQDRGIKVLFHSDGDLSAVLDDIVQAGFTGIHPVETMAGMDLKKIRARYPRLVILGGVDCSQLLPFGKPEEVYQVVRENIRDAGGYGYFAGSSSEINNEVPLENSLALYEAAGAVRSES